MRDPSRYINDESIGQACNLLRRIRPEWVVDDKIRGGKRISSQGFKDPTMSVHIEDDLLSSGNPVEAVLENYSDQDLAAIKAATARQMNQAVCREPDPHELCHGIVAGKKTGKIAKAFASEATANWLVRRER